MGKTMASRLDKLTILVPESRELDLFAGMLEAEGATTLRCPLVKILGLEDNAEIDAWLGKFLQDGFDDLILLTGEGLRRLLARSDEIGRKEAFVAALARTRTVTRGPKPAKALRELGLAPAIAAAEPTSQGIIAAFAVHDLRNRRIGVQLYPGQGGDMLLAALEAAGAIVFPVTPYRYASQTESRQVVEVIEKLAAGEIGMIAFTSSQQITRLMDVARENGMGKALSDGLLRTKIAAIGPVVEEKLRALGIAPVIRPQRVFHLKPFLNAIIDAWGS
jgi:uroporphyrinogen-III synthase